MDDSLITAVTPLVPARRALPVNRSAPIPCPLPGYDGVEVVFIVSRTQAQINEVSALKDVNAMLHLLVAAVPGWPFAGVAPGGSPESFSDCPQDLQLWLMRDGYQAAVGSLIKN